LNFELSLTIEKKKRRSVLAFCNAADAKRRDNLTLRISYDNGRSWKKSFVVDKDPANGKGAYTAYSDIVKLDKRSVGVIYEKDGYKHIVFKPVKCK
jgi:sialidase-1